MNKIYRRGSQKHLSPNQKRRNVSRKYDMPVDTDGFFVDFDVKEPKKSKSLS